MMITVMMRLEREIAMKKKKWLKNAKDSNSQETMRQFRQNVLNLEHILNLKVK
jgi:hypothetical protein